MIKKTLITSALIAGLFGAVRSAHAQYNADSATLDSGGQYTPRLFTDNTFTTPVPLNTVVWFVASTDTVLGGTNGVQSFGPGNFLGADDNLIAQLSVDGIAQGGLGTGMYESGGINGINQTNATKNIFAIVWNRTATPQSGGVPLVASGNGTYTGFLTPNIGDKFGVLSLGVQFSPFGNANYNILGNMSDTQFTFTAVPEPSVLALAGIGSLGLILRRRFRK